MTHTSAALSLTLGARLSREIEVDLSVPWRDLETDDRELRGIGDITATAVWSPFPEFNISFLGGLRLPTGDKDLGVFAGSTGEVVPLGNGAWEALLGASYHVQLLDRVRMFTSLVATIPLNDADAVPPAPTVLGSASVNTVQWRVAAAVTVAEPVDLYAALDVQWKDKEAGVKGDVGETIEWGTLGAVVELPGRLTLEVSWRIAHELVTVGVTRRF